MSKAFVNEDQQPDIVEPQKEPVFGDAPRHITPEGFKRLQAELDHLWRVERTKVTASVTAAAEEGDRSENAEYIYGKKRLNEIDSRIRYLSKLLDKLTVVEPRTSGDKIFFGAWATIEDEEGRQATYRIVGPDESDSKRGCISSQSPMAKALLGKSVSEFTTVHRPKGPTVVEIISIDYQQPNPSI